MAYVRHKIRNLNDLENLIPGLAGAETRRVHIEGLNDDAATKAIPLMNAETCMTEFEYPDEYWYNGATAVVNTRTGLPAQVSGPLYQVLPHKDFVCAIVDLMRQRGFNGARGYVVESNDGNRLVIRVVFDDIWIEEPGLGKNIQVGGEFSNSYDSCYAARGRAYYMRINCENQMVLSNLIPECAFTRNHVAHSQFELLDIVTKQTETFVTNLVKNRVKFKKTMSVAMSDDVEFKNAQALIEFMENVFKVPSHAEAIAEQAMKSADRIASKKVYSIDRWELYQAATFYASHAELTPNVQDQILFRAENRLLNPKRPIEIPV